jgi:hypothetical protein
MPAGRPTKYEDRFCEEVEAFMGQGFSLTAFAGHLEVNRSTLTEWADAHPEFSAAVSRAKSKRLLHWERESLDVAKEGGTGGRATMIVFGLKNMGGDEWADVQKTELTGKDGAPIQSEARHTVDMSGLTEEQLRAVASIKLPADI